MNKFQKIKSIISNFHKLADRHYVDYQAKEKNAREKYSEAGFKEEFMQKVWPEMAGKIWAECDDTIRKVEEVFDEIERDFKSWVAQPIDESTTKVLGYIDRFNLSLSLGELQVLEDSIRGSYFGGRIFKSIVKKNGYSVDVPSMKDYQDALSSARNNTALAIKAYAGSPDDGFPGRDLLQKWVYKGIEQGNYENFHLLYSYGYLNKGELDRLETMWGEARAPMRYSLTDAETEKVKKGVESIMQDAEIDKKAAQEIIKKDPYFKEKLISMPDDFFADKEALVSYFRLNEKEEKEESNIDPATKNAKEYGTRFQKVDAEMLRQYE